MNETLEPSGPPRLPLLEGDLFFFKANGGGETSARLLEERAANGRRPAAARERGPGRRGRLVDDGPQHGVVSVDAHFGQGLDHGDVASRAGILGGGREDRVVDASEYPGLGRVAKEVRRPAGGVIQMDY